MSDNTFDPNNPIYQPPGFYKGLHYTKYGDEITALRRSGDEDAAEKLLLILLPVIEYWSRDLFEQQGSSVLPPWCYGQLAIIYRKRKDYHQEVAILSRYILRSQECGERWARSRQVSDKQERLGKALKLLHTSE